MWFIFYCYLYIFFYVVFNLDFMRFYIGIYNIWIVLYLKCLGYVCSIVFDSGEGGVWGGRCIWNFYMYMKIIWYVWFSV